MNNQSVLLRGITWDHTRGYTSMVATGQRYHELNPQVEIVWEKRSLQAFADEPIDQLAQRYDLLILDHPWTGFAARSGILLPLDEFLPQVFLKDQTRNSVGKSHQSYAYNHHQWALAIDAATPVAASRPDLFQDSGLDLPESWEDLLNLARNGVVALPGIPQDTLMSFYMLCSTLGEDIGLNEDQLVSPDIGKQSLNMLRELGTYINSACYNWNPIQVYEAMTRSDDYLYSPFAYGYVNYSQPGYARKVLKFHDLVTLGGQPLITTLGGTGLAISTNCKHQDIALDFAQFVSQPNIQKGLYVNHGGQPGHRSAWEDPNVNASTWDFFTDTLPALDRAFLRPRYHGHMFFQDHAGAPIREFMMKGGDANALLNKLNALFQKSMVNNGKAKC